MTAVIRSHVDALLAHEVKYVSSAEMMLTGHMLKR